MHNIQIDSEFQALIPPLQAEELAQLEANILADGCRDPLVAWPMPTFDVDLDDGTIETLRYEDNEPFFLPEDDDPTPSWLTSEDERIFVEDWPHVLVDGHNRYSICSKHGLPFDTVEVGFESRSHAVEWIIKNQFGRRNLSDYQRGVLALRMKPIMEERARTQQLSTLVQNAAVSQISDERKPIRTDEAVSELANISRDTIRKIERIEEVAQPEVKALAAAGDVSINLASQFVDLPHEVQQEAIAAIVEHSEPAKEVMREAVKKAHVANNSGNNEWYTPADYIELARQVMGGIDTDPASSEVANATVKAATFYTSEDDGRGKTWAGNVWMNPPYAQPLIADFAEAVASKIESGEIDQACVLVNNGTETGWFQRMLQAASAVCFPRSRIRFVDPDGNPSGAPLQGQAVLYMGANREAFAAAFAEKGAVLFNG